MTREDALEATVWLMDGNNQEECDERWGSNPLTLINEIYDDFESREKELIEGQDLLIKSHEDYIEEVASRTCGNCRHHNEFFGTLDWCTRDYFRGTDGTGYIKTEIDFGCNKFERNY